MVAWKEKQAVVCGHLGEIQATLCGVVRDKCGEAAVGHLCPRLLDGLAMALQLLLLLQLHWDVVSPGSPHLKEMGLSTPGCSICAFLSMEYVACQENRCLKNLTKQEYRTYQRNSRIMK